jgi:hypothetical protein
MNPNPSSWDRLAAAARQVPAMDERDTAAPLGFATRVAALGLAAQRPPASLFASFSLRVSLRALGVASALAVVAAGTSYSTLVTLFSDKVAPVEAVASSAPAESPAVTEPAVSNAPASVAPAPAAPATGDDPVAELLDIVS